MKEKTITVSHEVSPEYGKCSFGGDFWGEEVCKYHALRTQTHGNKAPPEYRKPKCLLFNCWLEEPYKKCEMCRKARAYCWEAVEPGSIMCGINLMQHGGTKSEPETPRSISVKLSPTFCAYCGKPLKIIGTERFCNNVQCFNRFQNV